MEPIKVGDVLRVRMLEVISPDASLEVRVAPDEATTRLKQQVFVVLLLGTEWKIPRDGIEFDPEAALEAMGWRKHERSWDTITPEMRTLASKVRLHLDGAAQVGDDPRQTVSFSQKQLHCNGVQVRAIVAKAYRKSLRQALRNVDVVLIEADAKREGQESFVVLDVIDYRR